MLLRRRLLRVFLLSSATGILTRVAQARSRTFRLNGWLELRAFEGRVIWHRPQRRPLLAWVGMRLDAEEDAILSEAKSSAVFALDSGLGTVHVGENTKFFIKTLKTNAQGGRITQLHVSQGQVRLKVRPFANPSSRLEIDTPAGLAGVRGTEFGVTVQPAGKMGVATRSGHVDTTAQSQTVAVQQQQQTFVMPQEAPQPPQPLRDDTMLKLQIEAVADGQLHLVGTIDPVNGLLIEDMTQDTDREGKFDLFWPRSDRPSLSFTVMTPLGTRKRHEIPLPPPL